jgi:hypothetical protein
MIKSHFYYNVTISLIIIKVPEQVKNSAFKVDLFNFIINSIYLPFINQLSYLDQFNCFLRY